MRRYINTGKCPHCGVAILSSDYIRMNSVRMVAEALWATKKPAPSLLAPFGRKIKYADNTSLQCLTCMKTWRLRQLTAVELLALKFPPKQDSSQQRAPGLGLTAALSLAKVAGNSPILIPARRINVANYQLIRIKDQQEIETVQSRTKQTYPNPSSAKITHKIGITNSIARTVIIETNKAKTTEGQ